MALKFRRMAILAKVETVYATDPTPTGAANAIDAIDVEIEPLAGENVERGIIRPWLGAKPSILVGERMNLSFGVELAGAGAAGDVPAYGPLLRAAGLAETIDAGVNVEYDPVSTGEESATLYFHLDGLRHKATGGRCEAGLRINAEAIPQFRFSFTGLHVAPDDAALPAVDFTAFQKPVPVSDDNTPTFTLHGHSAVMRSLELNLGNDIQHRNLVNSRSVLLVDRTSNGRVSIEAPLLATKDYFAIAKASTLGAMQLVHGVGAGKVVQIDAPKVQVRSPRYENDQGIAMLGIELVVTPDAGDDEIKITVK